MARVDPHSYCDSEQPAVVRLDWRARVDFAARAVQAQAELRLQEASAAGPLDLDTRDLEIEAVVGVSGEPLAFTLSPAEPILGARLRVELPEGTDRFTIRYRTSPGASALQWLEPAQTAGGRHPFLFSQCQAIHARSMVPLQDTPRVRIRFGAELRVPKELRALMAAAFVRREERGGEAVEQYEMPQPIPPYLLALAVGELVSRDLGPRSRVWAEPALLERAAHEFADVDAMLRKAEEIFGRYEWDRFDILTMPPSFPYGGMENPRLTFLTPTLLAGDRSLVGVVAHELAHSWTGNLVTNATGDHFWLNEGFTVFAERRILEALYGADVAALSAALGRRSLEKALALFADRPELTRLRTDLRGIDPDDAYSEIPYEKGFLFLRTLEEALGRETFDRFLRAYIDAFRFRSITTEEFTAFFEGRHPGALARVGADAWLREPGLPANAPKPKSERLERLQALGARAPDEDTARRWTPTEWALYLESLPRPFERAACEALDERFRLTASRNYEVLVAWLALALESGVPAALPRAEAVLGEVGRMKYLKPLYLALVKNPATRERARRTFESHRASYHPIAQQAVEAIFRKHGG